MVSTTGASRRQATYSRNVVASAAFLRLLDLRVDLLVDSLKTADEILRLHLARLPLDDEVRERRLVVEPDRRDRRRLRIRVDEDLDERPEVLIWDQLR